MKRLERDEGLLRWQLAQRPNGKEKFYEWLKENGYEIPKEGEPRWKDKQYKMSITEEVFKNPAYKGLRGGRIEFWNKIVKHPDTRFEYISTEGYPDFESRILLPVDLYDVVVDIIEGY